MIFDILSMVGNNAMQQNAATQAYDRQVQFWNMQNDYNKPSAQVQRLEDAGLNKALAYGQGGNVSNTAGQLSSVPKADVYNSKLVDTQQMLNLLNVMSSLKTQEKEREVMDANIGKIESETQQHWSTVDLQSALADNYYVDKFIKSAQYQGILTDNDTKKIQQAMFVIDAAFHGVDVENKIRIQEATLLNMAKDLGVKEATIRNFFSHIRKNEAEMQKWTVEKQEIESRRAEHDARTGLLKQQGIHQEIINDYEDENQLAKIIETYTKSLDNVTGSFDNIWQTVELMKGKVPNFKKHYGK